MADDDRKIIVPQYKMIIIYDIRPGNRDQYYEFVMGEMVPTMQQMGVYMTEAWHTAYGDHPIRMVTFVSESLDDIEGMLASSQWQEMETKFKMYIENYTMKVIDYEQKFQFIVG